MFGWIDIRVAIQRVAFGTKGAHAPAPGHGGRDLPRFGSVRGWNNFSGPRKDGLPRAFGGGGAERGTASSGPASASTEKGASASLVKCGLPWATKRLGAPRRDLGSQASRVRARAMPEECEACKGGSRHRPMSSR